MPRRLLIVAALLVSPPAFAQLPPGKDCYAFPPGAKRGGTATVTLGGTDWTPDVQFLSLDPRVKIEPLGTPGPVLLPDPPFWFGIRSFNNDPNLPREVTAKLHLPADLPPGPVKWAVANSNGATVGGVFVVGTTDEVTEDEDRTGPQALPPPPVVVNGRLRRIEEVDRYTFTAAASGLVTCDLSARRLGNDFNGVVQVHDADTRVAEASDTEGTDPVLTFAAEKGKTYTVSVRDVEHRGYRNFTYRLSLTAGPRVVTAIPAVGRPGDRRAVEFVGYGLATGAAKLETRTEEVEFPRPGGEGGFTHTLDTPAGPATFTFALDTLNEQSATADGKLSVPGAVSGRLGKRGERPAFAFAGRKNERWEIALQARRLGSPLDATLTVLGPDGKQLAANDDADGGPDPRLTLTLPADGEYRVIVADVSGKTPGADAAFRLVVRRPADRFTLKSAGVVSVPVGGKAHARGGGGPRGAVRPGRSRSPCPGCRTG